MTTTATITTAVVVTVPVTVTAVSSCLLTDIFFQHHSTGRNLIAQGGVVAGLNALGYDLTDADYNSYEIHLNGVDTGKYPHVPDDDTDYPNWPDIWTDEDWLADALAHEVIILKACYPNSLIETDGELANDKTYVTAVQDVADDNTDKLFIIMTQPPLVVGDAGGAESAQRARDLADWMVANLADGRDNLVVFDLFDELADADNYLHDGWETGEHDSHPNATANAAVGPIFTDFVDTAIKAFG